MDFFGAQAQARRDSRLLGWAFALCVAAVVFVLSVGVLTALRLGLATGAHPDPMEASLGMWASRHPGAVALTLLTIAGFIFGASLWRMMQLRAGGGYVARSVGGVRVERDAQDPRRRTLHNVVEEMAIASGVPVPEVYVLEQEDGINAFAAGHSAATAAIAVTRGALLRLNREQLQGVIGHEFSHVLNGDIRISTRLMGMIFGLMAVAQAGRLLMRAGRHTRRGAVPAVLIGAVLALVGYVGWLAARVLQAWISRRREALADASAVQFTRNSEGLQQALIRVAAMGEFRRANAYGLEQIAHMLFANGARSFFATHPPLLQRLQALDGSITTERLESLKRQAVRTWQQQDQLAPVSTGADDNDHDKITLSRTAAAAPLAAAVPAAAAFIAATAGAPAVRHLQRAGALRRALPITLRASGEDPEGAQAILLSIVIFAAPASRERQMAFITEKLGAAMAMRAQQLAHVTATLDAHLRLPAVLQLIPALHASSPAARLLFTQVLRQLMRLDGGLSVFEYTLDKIAVQALLAQEDPRPSHGSLSLADCAAELGVVFAVLGRSGASDENQARQSYEAGLAHLLPRHRPAYGVMDDWTPLFDRALDRLCALQLPAKQLLIEGLVRTIAHDDLLAPAEAELLRAICTVLHCPLPPILPDALRGAA